MNTLALILVAITVAGMFVVLCAIPKRKAEAARERTTAADRRMRECREVATTSDVFRFSPELFEHRTRVIVELVTIGMWILGPMIVGVLATILMGATGWIKAIAIMGGPINSADFTLMYFVAIPAAFVSGILASRRGFIRALIGCIIYLSPILWFCLTFSAELKRDGLLEAATAILKVPIPTAVFAIFAALAFATVAHVNKQTREMNEKTSA